MGTRADFYVRRGAEAEWLGSTAWDSYPDGFDDEVGRPMLTATTADEFRAAVAHILASRNDATTPDMGWPWPWNDSNTTDYSYAFDGDGVYCTSFGRGWFKIDMADGANFGRPEEDDEVTPEKTAIFPDMSARKNVRHGGPASGLMVIGVAPDGKMRELTEEEAKPAPDRETDIVRETLEAHCTVWTEEAGSIYIVDGLDLAQLAVEIVKALRKA